jgi:hypothetical protein
LQRLELVLAPPQVLAMQAVPVGVTKESHAHTRVALLPTLVHAFVDQVLAQKALGIIVLLNLVHVQKQRRKHTSL